MLKKLWMCLALWGLISCVATEKNIEIASDESFRQGVLSNGLRYYIKSNQTPENRIYFSLATKVGSLDEEDGEEGIAHFLEHMAFNGSEHFSGNELVEFARDAGMQFGAHVNAYTGFDRTVYSLTLPADDEEILDKGFLVLGDWMRGLTLAEDAIDTERGVVISEYRLSKNANDRLFRKYMENWLGNSIYGRRLPIGKLEVLEKADAPLLRNFYEKWYHPASMALIAVGDFDAEQMQQLMEDNFSWQEERDIPVRLTHHPQELYTAEPRFFVDEDAEVGATVSYLLFPEEAQNLSYDLQSLEEQLSGELLTRILNNRLQDKKLAADPPFVQAGIIDNLRLGDISFYGLALVHKQNEVAEGSRFMLKEYNGWKQLALTEAELERAKASVLNDLKGAVESFETTDSQAWENLAVDEFFGEDLLVDPQWLLDTAPKLFELIELDRLQEQLNSLIAADRFVMQMSGNSAEQLLTAEELQTFYEEERKNVSFAELEIKRLEQLIKEEPQAGTIIKEEKNNGFPGWLWTLSNGVKVYFIPTQVEKNHILLQAFRTQGTLSMLSIEDDTPFYLAGNNFEHLLFYAGLEDYSAAELELYLEDKSAGAGRELGYRSSLLSASANRDDLEIMFQLAYLNFQPTRFKQQDIDKLIADRLLEQEELENRPRAWASNEFNKILYGDQPLIDRTFTKREQDQLKIDIMENVETAFFGDPSKFVFVVSGDTEKDTVKPLVEKYLASLSARSSWELDANQPTSYVYEDQERVLYRGNSGSARMLFHWGWQQVELSPKEELALQMLASVLDTLLVQQVREEQGRSYSPYAYARYLPAPDQRLNIVIASDFAVEEKEQIEADITNLVENLKSSGFTERIWKQVLTEAERGLENYYEQLEAWPQMIFEQYSWQRQEIINWQTVKQQWLKEISAETLVELAQRFLTEEHLIRLVHIEEEK